MALEIEGLSKHWGGRVVLDGISLSIPTGQFTALLGPSGCGKTTLLRLLAGLDTPDGGRILSDGVDITHLEPAERGMSMVFQSYALFPHLNVAENILFGLKARKLPKHEQQARLDQAVALVALDGHLHKKPAALSGGQRQRVALARAIVSQHPVCLMDEPLSNLDARLRADMRSELRTLQQALGLTLIYVTHDQIEAMSMADQIVLLDGGRVQQVGSPQALYEAPQTLFVARFIGQPPMNLLRLPGRDASSLCGIRPEHIQQHGPHAATVQRCEYHGADSLIHVELYGQPCVVKQPGRLDLAAGSRLTLGWPTDCERHFCSHTQQSIPSPTKVSLHALPA
ncbi:ABC transporter ATP-binding protein [Chitinimonas sp.]|uniref:ABC transporter ATP-binding protein n=1 Tax=Chitinimonas sp. TaxID=1934313 RepID=UPI0035B1B738